MRINCLIVDDEKPARDLLKEYIREVPFINVVGECKNAYETIDKLSSEDVHLLFLDIKMPKLNGIQLLRSLNKSPYVIITTAYREYALEGFELDVTDYLKKPFSYERFLKAVLKVKSLYEQSNSVEHQTNTPVGDDSSKYFFLKADNIIHKILLDELMYIEAMGDYAHFITENKKHVIYTTLKKVEMLLPPKLFVRVHRSFIVSFKYIDYIKSNGIFIGEKEIPIGKSYKDGFMKLLS